MKSCVTPRQSSSSHRHAGGAQAVGVGQALVDQRVALGQHTQAGATPSRSSASSGAKRQSRGGASSM
jgi:hypothetical protein